MKITSDALKSSIIVSVYKDTVALKLILNSLLNQTVSNFEIIISEDCQTPEMKSCVDEFRDRSITITHLTQPDTGFRKTTALNRAIVAASTEHIIFIDGDCVPHPSFIEAHQLFAKPGVVCAGRRLELGEGISKKIRNNSIDISLLTNSFSYLLNVIPLLLDKAKNIDSGIYSKFLHRKTKDRPIRILGSNFSCNKKDLIKINGFNEDYQAPGIGEDTDIDWRLLKFGVTIKNVKFSAIQYHLFHQKMYSTSAENKALFEKTKQTDSYTCFHGLKNLTN